MNATLTVGDATGTFTNKRPSQIYSPRRPKEKKKHTFIPVKEEEIDYNDGITEQILDRLRDSR